MTTYATHRFAEEGEGAQRVVEPLPCLAQHRLEHVKHVWLAAKRGRHIYPPANRPTTLRCVFVFAWTQQIHWVHRFKNNRKMHEINTLLNCLHSTADFQTLTGWEIETTPADAKIMVEAHFPNHVE